MGKTVLNETSPVTPIKDAEHLTHWGRVTHICVGNLTNIDSDNGLSPGRRQAIIWTNAGLLLIGPLGTNFNEILSKIHKFSFKKKHLKMSSGKWRLFCLGLNVLKQLYPVQGQGKYSCGVALHEGEEPIPTIKARRKDYNQLKFFINTQLEQS